MATLNFIHLHMTASSFASCDHGPRDFSANALSSGVLRAGVSSIKGTGYASEGLAELRRLRREVELNSLLLNKAAILCIVYCSTAHAQSNTPTHYTVV